MVHVQQEHVLALAKPQHRGAQQRPPGEVERLRCLFARQAEHLLLALMLGQVRQVHGRERHRELRGNDLDGARGLGVEGGAQGLVALDERVEAALQGRDVQLALHPDHGRDVVRRASRLELVEEPQPLLGEGQGQGLRPGHRQDARRRDFSVFHGGLLGNDDACLLREERGEAGHGRGLEDVAQGQLHAEGLVDARDRLRGQQRVSAQLEEAVVQVHALHLEQLREDGGDLLLHGIALCLGELLHQEAGEPRDRGCLEDIAQRQLHAKGLVDARDGLRGEQRVTAQLEEAVIAADALQGEELGEDGRDSLLCLSESGAVFLVQIGPRPVRSGQSVAVELVVGGEGQGLQCDEGGGHHVLGQPLEQVGSQRGRVQLVAISEHGVGDEAAVTGHVLTHEGDGLVDGRVLSEHGFDFAQLNTEAPQLHLRVGPTEEVELTRGQPPDAVPGAVHARAGRGAEGMGDEALSGEVGAVQVAAGEAGATDEELSGHAEGHRVQGGVEDVQLHVGQRATNGEVIGIDGAGSHGGADGDFGGAVGVEKQPALAPTSGQFSRQGLTSGGERAQRVQAFGRSLCQHRGRQGGGGDGLLLQQRVKGQAGHEGVARREAKLGAAEQGGEAFPHRGVEAEGGELQCLLSRLQAQRARGGEGGIAQAPVRQQCALGLAGGAGGEDDVGELVGLGHGRQVVVGKRSELGPVGVEAEEHLTLAGELVREVLLGEEHGRPCLLKHEGQALGGVAGVQRDVGATGLEHAEHGHDHVERALDAQSDESVGADAEGAQVASELVGAGVELKVGEGGGLEADGGGVRRALHLGFEELVCGGVRTLLVRLVPVHQHLLALGSRQHGQLREAQTRSGHGRLQQRLQVAHHPLDGLCLEQVGAVLAQEIEPVRQVGELDGDVELRRVVVHRQQLHGEAGHLQPRLRQVLEDELDLEEGRVAEAALGVERAHQLLERHVLVGVGAQRGLAHAAQQLAEGGVTVELRAHDELVDEEADEAFGLRVGAVGDVGADDDIRLTGVAGQQQVEGGQQRHVQRDALSLAQLAQRRGQLGRQGEDAGGAAVGARCRTRLVGGQLQQLRNAVELLAPPAELALEHFAFQPLALPGREVRVLEGQLGQGRGTARCEGLVEGGHLTDEDVHGPAVGDDVVHGQHQHVLALGQLQQQHAHQRSAAQVERALDFDEDAALHLGILGGVRDGGQVHHRQGQDDVRGNALDRHGVGGVEGGAQALMAEDGRVEGLPQGVHVQRALEPEDGRHVVERAVRLQPVEHPQALLREGQWQRVGAGQLPHRRVLPDIAVGLDGGVDARGQCGNGACLEELAQRQFRGEERPHAGNDLGGQQGVAAQVEEVIERADPLHSEQLAPDARERLLHGRARRHVLRAQLGPGEVRSREGLAVDLAVGSQGQGVQGHEGRGHHVLGQLLAQEAAQRRQVHPRRRGHHIGHQTCLRRAVLACRHHRRAHGRVPGEHRLHLAELDAVPAHLHLLVDAAEELHRSVRVPAHQVAGAIHARTRRG